MFYCRVYNKTGFNLVNVPDSVTLLNQFTHKDYPVIDILQLYHNTTIKLKIASEQELYDADFLVLSTDQNFGININSNYACYVINSYTMTSADVASVDVTMEPFLTAGGLTKDQYDTYYGITISDGMTERHHVDNLQEKFGDYVEDDDMLQPSYPMSMEFGGQYFYEETPVGQSSGAALIWTIARIDSGISFDINNNIDWVLSSDAQGVLTGIQSNSSGNNRTLTNWQCYRPWIQNVQDYLAGRTDVIGKSTHRDFCNLTAYLCANDSDFAEITAAMKKLYEWGVTDMVKEAYFIPRFWAQTCAYYSFNVANILRTYVCSVAGHYTSMKKRIYDGNAAFSQGGHTGKIKDANQRAFYGKHYAVTLVATGSGEMITKNPEEFIGANRSLAADTPFYVSEGYSADTSHEEGDKQIIVLGWPDIRPNGSVKFHVLNKGDVGDFTNGFYIKDYIKGGNWSKIDISSMGISGIAQQAREYVNNRNMSDMMTNLGVAFNKDTDVRVNAGLGTYLIPGAAGLKQGLTGIKQGLNNEILSQYNIGQVNGFGLTPASVTQDWANANMAGVEEAKNLLQREAQARAEAGQFAAGLVAKPVIQFSGDIDGDASFNSLVAFRLVPDMRDIQKFDRVLNMFGYKVTEPVSNEMMTNRPKFNYLKAKGVRVSTNNKKVPKSVLEEAGAAFDQGVRIWHVKPSANHYALGANNNQEV